MGVDYWRPLMDFLRDRLLAEGAISASDLDLFLVTDSIDEAMAFVTEHATHQFGLRYEARPRRLFGESA
jgi:predicted Rossmann-fold nucleotide-binding protein